MNLKFARSLIIPAVIAALSLGTHADDATHQPPGSPSAEQLVEQLGAPIYADRLNAEQALISLGMPAREALMSGLNAPDPHVRRSCRRLLVDVLNRDHAERLQAFLADDDGQEGHGLAGWSRFKALIGTDRVARKLFADMHRLESGLLESAEVGATEAIEMRLADIREMAYSRDPRERQTPPFATVAALLFVCSDDGLKIDANSIARSNFVNIVQQGDFGAALKDGDRQQPARTLLGEWIRHPSQMQLIYQNLRLAVSIKLTDAGLDLAFNVLDEWKNLPANYVASAIEAVARLGGQDYIAALDEMLIDERTCTQRVLPNKKRREIQVRDVALGWMVHLTQQKLADYGLDQASRWFDTLKRSPTASFNTSYFVFETDEAREAALSKWTEWSKTHPLPQIPRSHGEGKIATQDVQKPPAKEDVAKEQTDGEEHVRAKPLELAEWEIVRSLKRAEELAAEGHAEEAAELAGAILASNQDRFYQPERGVAMFRPLKAGAESLLARLPHRGRQAYEFHYGALARDLLDEAVASIDIDTVGEVDRGFFYTRAGAEAAYLLGCHHREAGRYVRAAVFFDRLRTRSPWAAEFEPALSLQLAMCWLRSGMAIEARELLQTVLADPPQSLDFGGRSHEVIRPTETALAWLETTLESEDSSRPKWPVFRGDISGNRVVDTDAPYLKAPLMQAFCEDEFLRQSLTAVEKSFAENRQTSLLTVAPLVVDDAIVIRTPTGIDCFQLDSGQIRWSVPAENGLVNLLSYGDPETQTAQQAHVEAGLRERLWEDPSFGTLSSDGRTVFLLEDRGFHFGPGFRPMTVRADGRRQLDTSSTLSSNTLSAYDVRTGKLLWELDGQTDRAALGGSAFLSPPLPLGDMLYIVAQFKDQARLCSLDAANGRVDLQWLLEATDEEIQAANGAAAGQRTHNQAGRSPSPIHAGGMIVSVTGRQHLVAVDLASRSVQWTFEPPAEASASRNKLAMQQAKMRQLSARASDQWADMGPVAGCGHVLFTPIEDNHLYCLDLNDGTLVWSADRKDGLYVAGIQKDMVIIVGRGGVQALWLADGQPAWKHPASFPNSASPSGRGYLAGDAVFVPLDSAEVVSIDLQDGSIRARALSPDEIIPGNLVPLGEQVVSLGSDGLRAFETLSARQQRLLASAEVDRVAVAEVKLHQGDVQGAIELLNQIRATDPSTRSSELLAEAMLQSLRGPLGEWGESVDELADSMRDPELRVRFHYELARAYREQGRLDLAWHNYLRLLDANADPEEMVDVSPAQTVQRSRLIQGQLASLWSSAPQDLRAEMDQRITEMAAAAQRPNQLSYFNFHPAADDARMRLATKAMAEERWISAELHLRRARYSPEPRRQAAATAGLAMLLRQSGQSLESARFYEQLGARWDAVECGKGKTGADLAADLPDDDPVAQILDRHEVWPGGEVKKSVAQRQASQPNSIQTTVPLIVTRDDPLAPYVSVDFNMSVKQLTGFDAQGKKRWSVDVSKLKGMTSVSTHSFYINEGKTVGHLLVVWLGSQVIAIDQLDGGKILWSRETSRLDQNQLWAFPFVQARLQARMFGRPNSTSVTQPMIVTTDYVAFQQGRLLVAVSPLTGETLWLRDDMPMGADLIGDREALLVTAPTESEAVVLNAVDGSILGRRNLPPMEQRLCVHGRCIATWAKVDDHTTLRISDPWQETVACEETFDSGAQACPVPGGEVAVFEPSGRFVVFSCRSGARLLDCQLDSFDALDGVFVTRNDRRYIVMANRPAAEQKGPATLNRTLPGFVGVNGIVTAIDAADGKRLWQAEVANQWFKLNHPTELPVLVFFKRYQKAIKVGNNSWRSDKPSILLRLLDARTGASLHDEVIENSYEQNYYLQVDADKHQVEVQTRLETVRLEFQES